MSVSTHSRLKAAGEARHASRPLAAVSTHSRLKAAGLPLLPSAFCRGCFNTQPPEGGWANIKTPAAHNTSFNTQPPEGGWDVYAGRSRLTACFNTQPPEGGWGRKAKRRRAVVRFNTQPPEGGWAKAAAPVIPHKVSTHSRLKAAGPHY